MFGMWFAKVDVQGDSGLSMRLMKARTQSVKVYTGEHSWKYIGAGNTVNIRYDEFKRNFVKAMLKRLNLTAADLPGINLEPILGAGR